jgi:RNA polymerase-binding transcription factor DksA
MKGDIADQAQDQIEAFNEQSVERARRKAQQPEADPDFNNENCLDCGIDIPKARLALGRIRCVECQTLLERAEKMKRGGR